MEFGNFRGLESGNLGTGASSDTDLMEMSGGIDA